MTRLGLDVESEVSEQIMEAIKSTWCLNTQSGQTGVCKVKIEDV